MTSAESGLGKEAIIDYIEQMNRLPINEEES